MPSKYIGLVLKVHRSLVAETLELRSRRVFNDAMIAVFGTTAGRTTVGNDLRQRIALNMIMINDMRTLTHLQVEMLAKRMDEIAKEKIPGQEP